MRKTAYSVLFSVLLSASVSASQQPAMSDSCEAHSNDVVPKFRVAKRFVNAPAQSSVMNVSVAPADATRERITALACKLGRDHARERVFVIWIFDDYGSAKLFRSSGEGVSEATKHALRASYSFDRDRDSQELIWTPASRNPSEAVKIRLGAVPALPGGSGH